MQSRISFKLSSIIIFLLLFMSIMPIINIGGFGLPVLYLLLPIGAFIGMFVIFGWIKVPKITKILIIMFIAIIAEIFISTLYGTVFAFNELIFPTDIIQYVARFITLVSFVALFYNMKPRVEIFIKLFLFFLNIAMLIGILQWIDWPGREIFIHLYPFRDGSEQLSQLERDSLAAIRLHGVAQFATANGGLATFFFVFGYSIYQYYKKFRFLSVSLMVLSIINIFASQARAGILALVFSFFLFYVVSVYINRKSFKPTVIFIFLMSIVAFIVYILYVTGNVFIEKMVYRWIDLINTSGGARVDQVDYFLSLLETPSHYLLGLSKPFVNQSLISHGVEIEPVNIFVTYGILGFLLQYLLVFSLLVYFFKNLRKSIDNKAALSLLVASFVGLFSYQVFSVAYYFFREIRVGLFPWILMGAAIGVYESFRNKKGFA